MQLRHKLALSTVLVFFFSFGVGMIVSERAFFVFSARQLFEVAPLVFDQAYQDGVSLLASPYAEFSLEGKLLRGTNPGLGERILQSLGRNRLLKKEEGGLLWIDALPYVWYRSEQGIAFSKVSHLSRFAHQKQWVFLFVSPQKEVVALTTNRFSLNMVLHELQQRSEKVFYQKERVVFVSKDTIWYSQVVVPGVIFVGLWDVSLWRMMRRLFFYIALVIFVLFFLLFFLFQMTIISRFMRCWQSFLKGVQHFRTQNYHYRVPLEKGIPYEMRTTIQAFNEMAETLEATHYATDKLFQQLRYNYYHDKLTGLPNGNKFLEDFSTFENPNLLLFDIQDFSEWNMYFGSSMGDKVLSLTAQRLTNLSIYQKTFLYKLWADRFLLVIDQPMERKELEVMATYFLENLSNLGYEIQGQTVYLSFVAGILGSGLLKPGLEGNAVLTSMAGLLKKAKGMRAFFFIAEDMEQLSHQTEINLQNLSKIREAIQNSYLVNFYQPIFHTQTKQVEKYEALVRIQLPSGEVIPPLVFLSLAKQAKLYSFISKEVVAHALKHFSNSSYQVSINFTPEDLADKKLRHFLLTVLSGFDNPSRVVMEITESESIENYEEIKEALKPFLALGCKLAIDDFGAGYSNFYHVFSLDPDYIKIDGSLIKNIDTDTMAYLLVKSICVLACELGIKTIAEYVHNESVWEKVVELGIDYSQGYYLGPPQPYEKLFHKE